jgi:hypothetical protein
MELSAAYISIWDAAHDWHNTPVAIENVPLPPPVRDTLTALLHAVVNSELAVYEAMAWEETKGGRVGGRIEMMDTETAPEGIVQMYVSGSYDRALLTYYRLSMDGLFSWVVRSGGDLPRFVPIPHWASRKAVPVATSMRPEAEDRRACQEIAKRKWAVDDQIRIAAMARDQDILLGGNGKHYTEPTLLRWLREVAPPTVKGRPGRPAKKPDPEN